MESATDSMVDDISQLHELIPTSVPKLSQRISAYLASRETRNYGRFKKINKVTKDIEGEMNKRQLIICC